MFILFHKRLSFRQKINSILTAGVIMILGLLALKYLPMTIWGSDIVFDASMHITATVFVLYVFWYFIDQNRSWHIPFFILGALILAIVSFQRIAVAAHNDIGLLGGLIISLLAIAFSRPDYFGGKFNF